MRRSRPVEPHLPGIGDLATMNGMPFLLRHHCALLLLCGTVAACAQSEPSAPTTVAIDPFVAAAQSDAPADAIPCVSCHLANGGGRPDGVIPRLAGQPAAILSGKLERLAAGTTNLPAMTAYAGALSAAARARVASWFAHLPIPEGIGQGDPVLRERGATVYARLCAA
ncbi:MAG: hypothetical protein D6761_08465, partial [Candidatus Dadabacteria bacterium]